MNTVKYNPKVVIAFFKSAGIPEPLVEWKFHPDRKWRFDFAWPWHCPNTPIYSGTREACDRLADLVRKPLALEVQGGLFVHGGHTRGAQMLKDYEKYNAAASLGWRLLYVQPKDLCLVSTANLIKRCLGI